MAFKNLNAEEMIQISGTWLDASQDAHAAILAVADLASSLPRIQDAHAKVLEADQPAASPRIAAIIELEGTLDIRHDSIIRGSHGALTSLAELIGGDKGTDLIGLRDLIFPDGLSSQQKTYRAQAGQAAKLADRMGPEVRKRTDTIMIGEGKDAQPLTAYIDELIEIGKQFSALENERGQLGASASGGAESVKARNLWVRVANVLVAHAALADLEPEKDHLIFGPLRDAERKADERARQAAAKEKAAKAAADKAAADKAAGKPEGQGSGGGS